MTYWPKQTFWTKLRPRFQGQGTSPITNQKSLLLDGVNEIVDFGNNFDNDSTAAQSWSGWFKPNPVSTRYFFSKGQGDSSYGAYCFPNGPNLAIGLVFTGSPSSGSTINRRVNDTGIPLNNWIHIVWTYSGSQDVTGIKMYVNSVEATYTNIDNDYLGTSSNSDIFQLASLNNTERWLAGNNKDVAIWTGTELSAAQVAEVYGAGTPPDLSAISVPPSSWWRLGDDPADDATGGTGVMNDQIGAINGTPINTEAGDIVNDSP